MHQFFFPTNPFNRTICENDKNIFLIISCGVGYEISGLFARGSFFIKIFGF